jgi:transcriptional regulator with XRE-family HTH domain
MGKLYDLIQEHIDSQGYEVTPAQVARKIGVSRQTVLNWREPAKLPMREHLQAIARVTGVPYQRVLDAVLDDIGYLHPRVESDEGMDVAT